jgi:hypothetical protein
MLVCKLSSQMGHNFLLEEEQHKRARLKDNSVSITYQHEPKWILLLMIGSISIMTSGSLQKCWLAKSFSGINRKVVVQRIACGKMLFERKGPRIGKGARRLVSKSVLQMLPLAGGSGNWELGREVFWSSVARHCMVKYVVSIHSQFHVSQDSSIVLFREIIFLQNLFFF